ncbi:hypothetical protein L873DRAFT_1677995 [Choiromyces venosus 120613-1]|uniref:Mid2 domain-containing protein n=1 Tax=Choiromyces venosus 120613-1 TaxID=1336337 RepID=A0A3N4JS52_9PEZI|nr:hypothetical protein L873DRAFT_1677995 [Choiromyces venosus 120613-1]
MPSSSSSSLQTLLLFLLLQSLITPASALPRKVRFNVGGGAAPTGRATVKLKSPGVIAGIALGGFALIIILLAMFIWRRKVWQDREDQEDRERAGRAILDDTGSPAITGRDGSLDGEGRYVEKGHERGI